MMDHGGRRLSRSGPEGPRRQITLAARLAAAQSSRSFRATRSAVARLLAAGILTQVRAGRRNRAFEAPELIEAFTDLEHQLANPAGDIRREPPSRPVPARPDA